ncbi:uncharacterized protein K489DRAFT_429513 [Dissoconium aciculare CBS 342.82]|uniref:Uncharacterized protein n=1 Tax=Dissoconium aciculare CBS 342.82 TaxID=1314786 RepID=A0A6J3MB31_9PEZI|nr:uncharacterized protein K489DRAFT_429513 [Dissoconium aciculare CBS 342.82]KAF1825220.1 hypothetical protein K489DRAFT_429513 [Dissoconium aciculare CBS 342.82]
MRWTILYQTLAAAALTHAFTIPREITADGVYKVVTRDDGTEVHTKVADIDIESTVALTSAADEHDILKRSVRGQIWCGCGYTMNPGNCDAAVQDLKNQMGKYIGPHLSFYSIRSNVVAFACNQGSQNVYADAGTYGTQLQKITSACGRYIAGSLDLVGGSNPFIVGYMRYSNGLDFCRDSTISGNNRC